MINIYCVKLIPQCILLYGTGQRFNTNCLCSCKPTVGWNDIELFVRFSKTGTMLPFRFIFWVQFQKIGEFCQARRDKVFIFKKSQWPKKNYFETLKIPSFTLNNSYQKENLELNFIYICWRPPKWAKYALPTVKANFFVCFSSVFAYKQTKEQILFQVQSLKKFK